MSDKYILDEAGNPVVCDDLLTWAQWMEENQPHIVAQTHLKGDVLVSTVFLGMDHSWGDGPPLLFETMVFHDGDGTDQYRYPTREDAWEGHRMAVQRERRKLRG